MTMFKSFTYGGEPLTKSANVPTFGVWKGLPIIAIGPKGGQIVAYKNGKPVYAGSSVAQSLAYMKKKADEASKLDAQKKQSLVSTWFHDLGYNSKVIATTPSTIAVGTDLGELLKKLGVNPTKSFASGFTFSINDLLPYVGQSLQQANVEQQAAEVADESEESGWPDLEDLTEISAGSFAGTHNNRLFKDTKGNRFLFKAGSAVIGRAEEAVSRFAKILLGPGRSQKAKFVTFKGKPGALIPVSEIKQMAPEGHDIPLKYLEQHAEEFIQHHVFDWLMAQHDTHAGNLQVTADGKQLFAIDKGQAFKLIGQDSLSTYYTPNEHKQVYSDFWNAYGSDEFKFSGKDTAKAAAKVLAKAANMSEDQIISIIGPYLEAYSDKFGSEAASTMKTLILKRFKNAHANWENFLAVKIPLEIGDAIAPKPTKGPEVTPAPKTSDTVVLPTKGFSPVKKGTATLLSPGSSDKPAGWPSAYPGPGFSADIKYKGGIYNLSFYNQGSKMLVEVLYPDGKYFSFDSPNKACDSLYLHKNGLPLDMSATDKKKKGISYSATKMLKLKDFKKELEEHASVEAPKPPSIVEDKTKAKITTFDTLNGMLKDMKITGEDHSSMIVHDHSVLPKDIKDIASALGSTVVISSNDKNPEQVNFFLSQKDFMDGSTSWIHTFMTPEGMSKTKTTLSDKQIQDSDAFQFLDASHKGDTPKAALPNSTVETIAEYLKKKGSDKGFIEDTSILPEEIQEFVKEHGSTVVAQYKSEFNSIRVYTSQMYNGDTAWQSWSIKESENVYKQALWDIHALPSAVEELNATHGKVDASSFYNLSKLLGDKDIVVVDDNDSLHPTIKDFAKANDSTVVIRKLSSSSKIRIYASQLNSDGDRVWVVWDQYKNKEIPQPYTVLPVDVPTSFGNVLDKHKPKVPEAPKSKWSFENKPTAKEIEEFPEETKINISGSDSEWVATKINTDTWEIKTSITAGESTSSFVYSVTEDSIHSFLNELVEGHSLSVDLPPDMSHVPPADAVITAQPEDMTPEGKKELVKAKVSILDGWKHLSEFVKDKHLEFKPSSVDNLTNLCYSKGPLKVEEQQKLLSDIAQKYGLKQKFITHPKSNTFGTFITFDTKELKKEVETYMPAGDVPPLDVKNNFDTMPDVPSKSGEKIKPKINKSSTLKAMKEQFKSIPNDSHLVLGDGSVLKCLNNGTIFQDINIKLNHFAHAAAKKIKTAGGAVVVLPGNDHAAIAASVPKPKDKPLPQPKAPPKPALGIQKKKDWLKTHKPMGGDAQHRLGHLLRTIGEEGTPVVARQGDDYVMIGGSDEVIAKIKDLGVPVMNSFGPFGPMVRMSMSTLHALTPAADKIKGPDGIEYPSGTTFETKTTYKTIKDHLPEETNFAKWSDGKDGYSKAAKFSSGTKVETLQAKYALPENSVVHGSHYSMLLLHEHELDTEFGPAIETITPTIPPQPKSIVHKKLGISSGGETEGQIAPNNWDELDSAADIIPHQHGYSIRFGPGGFLMDGQLRMHKVKLPDGKVVMRFVGDLTKAPEASVMNASKKFAWLSSQTESDPIITGKNKNDWDPETGIHTQTDEESWSSGDSYGKDLDNGAELYTFPSNIKTLSRTFVVDVPIDGDAKYALTQAVEVMGYSSYEVMAEPDEQDERIMIKMQLLRAAIGNKGFRKIASMKLMSKSKNVREAFLDKKLAFVMSPEEIESARVEVGADGFHHVVSDDLDDLLYNVHCVVTGISTKGIQKMLQEKGYGGQAQTLWTGNSKDVSYTESGDDDMHSGGGYGKFFRIQNKQMPHTMHASVASHKPKLIVHPRILKKTNWYGTNKDGYGSQVNDANLSYVVEDLDYSDLIKVIPKHHRKDLEGKDADTLRDFIRSNMDMLERRVALFMNHYSNELSIENVSVKDVAGVLVNNVSDKKETIKALKQFGYEDGVNGIPFDDFIVVGATHRPGELAAQGKFKGLQEGVLS